MTSKADLLRHLSEHQDQHIAFLQALVRAPCPNPPGDTREAASIVKDYLTSHDVQTEIIAPLKDAHNIVTSFQATSPNLTKPHHHLVLNGHLDHFPVEDSSSWQRDAYSGAIANGRLHGRGTVDMKAGTAALVIAFAYLHKAREHLSGTCVLEAVSDEENVGKYGTRYLLTQDPRRSLWRGECVLNTEPVGLNSIRFGEKGTLRMTFTVTTNGGHGAYVFRNEGAIRVAARLIDRLVGLETLVGHGMDPELKRYLQQDDVRRVADEIMGPGAGNVMLTPTVNIGTIKGGAKINMIPASCAFEVDIRLPIGLMAEKMLVEIDTILKDFPGASHEVHDAHSNPPAYSSHTHGMVRHIQSNAPEGKVPLPICSLGATDCKHFRYQGVPAYTIGPRPDGMGERDESVSIEEFLATIRIVTLAAWDYLDGPE